MAVAVGGRAATYARAVGLLYAARFEEFVREHSPLLTVLVCVLAALLVVRVVARAMTRVVLLGVLALIMLFVYVERDDIRQCTVRCECRIAGVDIEVPSCQPGQFALR